MLFCLATVKHPLPKIEKLNNYFDNELTGCRCADRLWEWVSMSTMWHRLRSGGFPYMLLLTTSGNSSVNVPRIQSSLNWLFAAINHQQVLIGASATAICSKVSRHTITQPVQILKLSLTTYIPERNWMWSMWCGGKIASKTLRFFGGFLQGSAIEGPLYICSTRMRDRSQFLVGLNSAIIVMCVFQGWRIAVDQGNYSVLISP